jgi:hypothetical protein
VTGSELRACQLSGLGRTFPQNFSGANNGTPMQTAMEKKRVHQRHDQSPIGNRAHLFPHFLLFHPLFTSNRASCFSDLILRFEYVTIWKQLTGVFIGAVNF